MKELGLDDKVLLEAGLTAQRDDGKVVPRFRARLLFPIHDLRGRAVGFGGRLLVPGEPKYLNSPETPIFHKGKQLYNLHQAKTAIRKEESVILVEGYFDVFRLVLAGIEHVVAPLGTALTGDQAGAAAPVRAARPRCSTTATRRASGPPSAPATSCCATACGCGWPRCPTARTPTPWCGRAAPRRSQPILEDGIDLLERKIQLLERKGWFEGVEHQREALDRLLPTIRAAADPITRDLYLKTVSERTGVSREVLREQAAGQSRPAAPGAARCADTEPRPASRRRCRRRRAGSEVAAERLLLWVMLRDRSWIPKAATEVPAEWFETPVLREVYEAMLRSPENVQSAIFLEQLSPLAQKALARGWTDRGQVRIAGPR